MVLRTATHVAVNGCRAGLLSVMVLTEPPLRANVFMFMAIRTVSASPLWRQRPRMIAYSLTVSLRAAPDISRIDNGNPAHNLRE